MHDRSRMRPSCRLSVSQSQRVFPGTEWHVVGRAAQIQNSVQRRPRGRTSRPRCDGPGASPEKPAFLPPPKHPARDGRNGPTGKQLTEIGPAILTYINFSLKGTMLLGRWQRPPTATLIRASRWQLMQVNIGSANLRQTVFDEGLTRLMNRVRGGMSAWI